MGNEMKFLVRSFSNVEPQKLRLGLLAACFLVSLTYFSMTKPFVVILPTINSRLSTNIETMSVQEARQNTTLVTDVRCNVSDPISDLCEKFDVLRLESNATTRNKSASSSQDVDDGNGTTSMTERSYSHDDAKLVLNEAAPSILSDPLLDTKKSVGSDANLENSQKPPHEGGANLVKNFTTPALPAVPQLESDASLKGSQKVNHDLQQAVEKRIGGDAKVVEKPTAAIIPSTPTQQIDITKIGIKPIVMKPLCDFSNRRADICELKGDVRITGKNFTVIVASSRTNESYTVRPYPRKSDGACMSNVHQVHVLSSVQTPPTCTVNHTVPALVFSDFGYTGNYFHDFTDVLVPMFLTARQYDGNVQFLVTDFRWWWIDKYLPVFKHLSRFPVIDLDKDDNVRCFPNAIVGLKAHNDLTIDTRLAPLSMVDFTSFMRKTYSLERHTPVRPRGEKPRLLIIARGRTRRFTNLEKIVRSAEKMGFEVVVAENGGGAKIAEFARIVNSCDVMMGVHGAGLTNLVFLPTNAVLIQVVPWGKLDWIAGTYFGGPARDMRLKYLEYSIGLNESTLIEQYSLDDPVIVDPMSLHRLGWLAMGDVYLVKQNVRLDVRRFRKVLSKAMKLVRQRR